MSPEPAPPFDPAIPGEAQPTAQPTKKEAVIVASKAGGVSMAYTGAGVTGGGAIIFAAKRLWGIEMTAEEAMAYMAASTFIVTPLFRVIISLFRQWLEHRNYTLP